MDEDKFILPFTFSGRDSTYKLDVRRLACTGIPKKFDQELVVNDRLEHMDNILSYIDSRTNSSKQNAFSNIKAYIAWCENNKAPLFTLDTLELFSNEETSLSRIREIKRLHKIFGVSLISKQRVTKKSKKPHKIRNTPVKTTNHSFCNKTVESHDIEGVLSSVDGSHFIGVNTRSRGYQRLDISDSISHLSDTQKLFEALRHLFDDYAGDTFLSHIGIIKIYSKSVANEFFSVESLHKYVSQLRSVVKTKSDGANAARRNAMCIINVFSKAEINVPVKTLKIARKLPNGKSTPVEGYDQKRYRELLKMLFAQHTESYQYLCMSEIERKTFSTTYFTGFEEALTTFMNSAYYLIAKYSAWTDTTIKNLMLHDVELDSTDGEWAHLRSNKYRGEHKRLELDLTQEPTTKKSNKIKKSGYSLIKNILHVHEILGVNFKYLLFKFNPSSEICFFTRNDTFKNQVLNNIGELKTLSTQRIRETEISMAHKKGLRHAIARSGSQPGTVMKHYSAGSPIEHNKELNNVANVISTLATSSHKQESISSIKAKLYKQYEIPVLNKDEASSNTPMGTRCGTNSTTNSFTKKSDKNGFGKLSCASLLSCFECKHASVIDAIDDIWNFLSFQEKLVHGKMFSVDKEHHAKNFNEVLAKIEIIIDRFTPKHVEQARTKLNIEGSHPFWDEDYLF